MAIVQALEWARHPDVAVFSARDAAAVYSDALGRGPAGRTALRALARDLDRLTTRPLACDPARGRR